MQRKIFSKCLSFFWNQYAQKIGHFVLGQPDREIDRQTQRQTDKRKDRQTYKQNMYLCVHVLAKKFIHTFVHTRVLFKRTFMILGDVPHC